MAPDNQPVILFDGICNLCNRSVQFVLRHDKKKRFLFSSLQSTTGNAYLKQFTLPEADFHSFILVEGNNYTTQSTAALRVLKLLGNGWALFYAFIIVPKFIRDVVYRFIAKNRYRWFGKRESCWLPTTALKNRFLD
jgi:predicted DCC family thiol-disulfide oxidoreductase YuxK